MCVVELEDILLMKLSDVVVCLHVLLDRALKCGGHEEVLLFETQLLALDMVIAGIEDVADRAGQVLLFHGFLVLTSVKRVQLEAHYRLRVPDSQSIYKTVAVSDDRQVIGNSLYSAVAFLFVHGAAVSVQIGGDISAEVDFLCILRSSQLQGIAVIQPVVRNFHLIAVSDLLLEHTVLVADTCAVCGIVQSCKGIQEACRKSSKTAITESRVGLLVFDGVKLEAELFERLLDGLISHQVDGVIAESAAHEELHGQVNDLLGILFVEDLLGPHPAVDDLVLQSHSGSLEDLLVCRFLHGAAVHCAYIVLNTSLEKIFVKIKRGSFYHSLCSP